jgi:hypothetical protein
MKIALICLVLLITAGESFCQKTSAPVGVDPLTLRLSHGPLVLQNVPLTRALREIGFQIERGYVLFGAEVQLQDGKEPNVTLDLPKGSSLQSALEQALRQIEGYKFKVEGEHLINIYPKDAESDPKDLLNTRVERFTVVDKPPSLLLATPQSYIPALHARLTLAGQPSGTAGSVMGQVGEPRVSLELQNVTVRQILNAVTEATEQFPRKYFPLGWAYFFEPPSASSAEAKHYWRSLFSASSNWKDSPTSSLATPGNQHLWA